MKIHVYPLGDIIEHNTEDDNCWCKPKVDEDLVVHNSLDERENVMKTENEEFIKHDQGKPDPSLIPYAPLLEVAKVLGHGAEKYGRDNWRQGTKDRYKAALGRHVFAYMDGEERDPETGLEHLAHVICNCLFLMELGDEL